MVHKTEKDIALELVVDKLDDAAQKLCDAGREYMRVSETIHHIDLDGQLSLELREASKQFMIFMPREDLPEELLPVVQAAENAGYHVKYTTVEREYPR